MKKRFRLALQTLSSKLKQIANMIQIDRSRIKIVSRVLKRHKVDYE